MSYWINIEPHRMTGSTTNYRPFDDFREAVWQAVILRRRGHKVTIITTTGEDVSQDDEDRQLQNMKIEIPPTT